MKMGLLMSPDADRASVVRAFAQHCAARVHSRELPGLGG